jgi:putative nucleotidyltransferase with HDIG domain
MTIVVTGVSSTDNAIDALRRGAYDFLTKPIIMDAFVTAVKRGLEIRRLRKENMLYQQNLEKLVEVKSHALKQTLSELENAQMFILEALVSLLDAREHSTGQHSLRVCEVTVFLARELGYSDAEVEEFARGALLHDIGKIAIPDAVLLKPGKLTEEEMIVMQTHAEIGYQLLAGFPYLKHAAEIVHQHQERYDGGGFPQGLKGGDICDGARLFAVIDAYDAMRSDRVYRKALPADVASHRIAEERGRQFDPGVVDAFLKNIDEIERIGRWEERDGDEGSSRTDNVLEIVKRAKAAHSVNMQTG